VTRTGFAVLSVALLLAAGCGAPASGGGTNGGGGNGGGTGGASGSAGDLRELPLEGTRWHVDTLVDGQVASSVPAGARATVAFSGGTATVATGCNTGSATYQVSGAAITIGPLAVTRRACAPEVMRLERAVLAVLDGTITYRIGSDRLSLDHPSGQGLRLAGERP
jgi:heat shock protein HslJ